MSGIQNDFEILDEGRKQAPDIKTDAQEHVPSLKEMLVEDNIGSIIVDQWVREQTLRSTQNARRVAQLELVDNFHESPDGANPYGGSSQLHIPLAFVIIKTYHARFLEMIFSMDPPVSVKARNEGATSAVQSVEDLMRFTLLSWANKGAGIEGTADKAIWRWCAGGTFMIKNSWRTEYERVVSNTIRYQPDGNDVIENQDGSLTSIPRVKEIIDRSDKVERTAYCPQYDCVYEDDYAIIGGRGNLDDADMVVHRTYLHASDLWTGVDQGLYAFDDVEAVIRGGESNTRAVSDNTSQIKQTRLDKAGYAAVGNEGRSKYEVLEVCMTYCIDDTGIPCEIVVLVAKETQKVLHATFLRTRCPDGRRPYAMATFHSREDDPYGLGLAEILAPFCKEIDIMHNTRIDNVFLQATPFFFYRKSAGIDPKNIILTPGSGIPVNDPTRDIVFPTLPNRATLTANEEQLINQYVEKLTGISELSLGVPSSTQGVTRTATGAQYLMGENNSNLSVHLKRLSRGWTRMLENTWSMLKARVEPGFVFRVQDSEGRDMFRRVENTSLMADVDFELTANSSNANKSVQIQNAQMLMQINQNPLLIQLGIVNADTNYAALKTMLSASGIRDAHRYIVRPQNYQYAMSPEDEFMRIVNGQTVQVMPQQNHQAFISYLQTIMDEHDKAGQGSPLSEDQLKTLAQQIAAHQKMQDALQQMASQQANVGQMNQNMQMSPGSPVPSQNNQGGPYGQVF